MKGIHKNNHINVGNVEMQRAAFQQAKAKKASLRKGQANIQHFRLRM